MSVVFVVAGLVAFGRGLSIAFVSDDWVFLYDAFHATGPADTFSLVSFSAPHFVRPVQSLVTWALFSAFRLVPTPYHLASLLLHVVNAALVYALVRRLASLDHKAAGTAVWLAAGSGLLFFLNWHHNEAIFWFSSINEPLSALLRLLTLLFATEWLRRSSFPVGFYALSIGCMGLALLAKESAAALPLELLVLIVFVGRSHAKLWTVAESFVAFVPFGLILAAWLALYLSGPGVIQGSTIERSGLQVMHGSPMEWLLRSLQYLDGHYAGGILLGQNELFLILELAALAVLVPLAFVHRQSLWLFALLWTLAAGITDVAVIPQNVESIHQSILAVGVFGDRYLYYSSAGAGLLLMVSLLWIGQEVWAADRRRGIALGTAVATGLVMLLLGFNLVHLVSDESDWEIAGQIGKAIVQQAVQGMAGKAGTLCIAHVPDNYRGKYIFRNGLGSAIQLADPQAHYAIKVLTDPNTATSERSCTFVVDGNPIVHSWANQ